MYTPYIIRVSIDSLCGNGDITSFGNGTIYITPDSLVIHTNHRDLKLKQFMNFMLAFLLTHVGLDDDITVQDHLKSLLKEELKELFRRLGLSPTRVELKYDSALNVYRNDLVRSWILEDDKVIEKGGATWENLRDVLRSMDKIGIADSIPT